MDDYNISQFYVLFRFLFKFGIFLIDERVKKKEINDHRDHSMSGGFTKFSITSDALEIDEHEIRTRLMVEHFQE